MWSQFGTVQSKGLEAEEKERERRRQENGLAQLELSNYC